MRETRSTLATVLLAALCAAALPGCTGVVGGGQAACAATLPVLEVSPARAAPGEPLRLRGEGFYGEFVCDDTGPPSLARPAGGRPTDGIRIEFLQGTRTWTLATVSSNKKLSFGTEELKVPAEAAPGEALVRATSPPVRPGDLPPQAEAPFLVLGDLPRTGDQSARP